MRPIRFGLLACTLAAALLSPVAARAAFITSASDPALSGGTVITVDGLPNQTAPTLTIQGVTIAGNQQVSIGSMFAGSYNTSGTHYLDNNQGLTTLIDITFPSEVTAFGFNWGDPGIPWFLNAYGSAGGLIESHMLPFAGGVGGFFGIAAPGIASASLSALGGSDSVFIDNLTFAQAAEPLAVTEPETLAAFGAGLIGLLLIGRLRPRRA